ncbi:hypothetical protein FH972_010196 [Carpinus fangiana]|uniref:Protein kinase domain-containing protein n=1 Tax=Carpinus fangiana TaxID=176857 RepID=A0A660KML4_9ROSI|nr:hypothetical protein FH972_010196 [Carpinus fangiana]
MGVDRLIRRIRLHLLPWLHKSPHGPILFVRHLPYKDIKKATDGFHRIIYCNSHGTAYKARFQDGGVALVKEVTAFSQELDVFYREVQLLGRLHHRHLLPLRGFSTGNKRVLIFDSIENGSLKEHLSDPLKTPLNWRTRLQIAIGVAAALEYLLLFSDLPMYHVSITSSSVMLDENFTAKLSDVSLLSSGGNYVTVPHTSSSEGYFFYFRPCNKFAYLLSQFQSAFVYLYPFAECAVQERGNLILQLGVLILELITGQCSEEGGADLIQWVQGSRFASSMHQMIDPDLGNDYNSSELKKLLAVAKLCLKSGDEPMFSIPQILHYVQKKLDVSRD